MSVHKSPFISCLSDYAAYSRIDCVACSLRLTFIFDLYICGGGWHAVLFMYDYGTTTIFIDISELEIIDIYIFFFNVFYWAGLLLQNIDFENIHSNKSIKYKKIY